jgi:predicted transcriptional regulator
MHEIDFFLSHFTVHIFSKSKREYSFVMFSEESHESQDSLMHQFNTISVSPKSDIFMQLIQLLHLKSLQLLSVIESNNLIKSLTDLEMNKNR